MSSRKIEIVKKESAGLPFPADRLWVKLDGEMYSVIVSQDELGPAERRWHVSVSKNQDLEEGNHDVPVWRDFVAIVHHVRPGVMFALPIPPRNRWMNKNPNVLHAYEIRDVPLETEMSGSAQAVQGTPYAEPS